MVSVASRFGCEGWIWDLIASVPALCILFTFPLIAFINACHYTNTLFKLRWLRIFLYFPTKSEVRTVGSRPLFNVDDNIKAIAIDSRLSIAKIR